MEKKNNKNLKYIVAFLAIYILLFCLCWLLYFEGLFELLALTLIVLISLVIHRSKIKQKKPEFLWTNVFKPNFGL